MAKINVQPDCGNSPKKQFLKELNIAFATGDLSYVTEHIPDEIEWEIIGKKKLSGKENYLKELKEHKLWKVEELDIESIITHGNEASASGRIITTDQNRFAFCDVYKFKGFGNTKIKSITTFLIQE